MNKYIGNNQLWCFRCFQMDTNLILLYEQHPEYKKTRNTTYLLFQLKAFYEKINKTNLLQLITSQKTDQMFGFFLCEEVIIWRLQLNSINICNRDNIFPKHVLLINGIYCMTFHLLFIIHLTLYCILFGYVFLCK